MIFTNLSATGVLAGLLALAVLTYFLQWIKIRHQPKKVATLIFWQKVLEQTRATTFWERFRHFWAYLVVLAICFLLWLSIAQPEPSNKSSDQFTVLLLDGSASMTGENQLNKSKEQLQQYLAGLNRNNRQVYWVAGDSVSLLSAGEDKTLLDKRLEKLEAQSAKSGIERQINHLANVHHDQSHLNIVIFGNSPVRKDFLDNLPDSIRVTRQSSEMVSTENSGITGLGISRAASGDWFRVDLSFQIRSSTQTENQIPFEVTIDGTQVDRNSISATSNSGSFLIKDLPAAGQLIEVELLRKDALSIDNSAKIRLPKIQPIKVKIADSLKTAFLPILEADPAMELVSENEQVQIIDTDQDSSNRLIASMQFNAQNQMPDAVTIERPENDPGRDGFLKKLGSIGLENIGVDMADSSENREITIGSGLNKVRSIKIWKELLSENYNFTRSRTFPIFVSQSLRWLAEEKGIVPYAAVGQPISTDHLENAVGIKTDSGQALDLMGKKIVPKTDGTLQTESHPIEVAFLDTDTTMQIGQSDQFLEKPSKTGLNISASWVTWLLLGALAFISAEWFLFQTGRMP